MEVEISDDAISWLVSQGGSLYLWEEPVADAWALDRMSTVNPGPPYEFDAVFIDETPIQLQLERSLPEANEVKIEMRHMHHGVRVYWDGLRWGWRGEGGGEGG
jgi:hypothetical protein